MSDVLGTYSFLPWLRLGIANNVVAADKDQSVKLRASIPIELKVTGAPADGGAEISASVSRQVELFGPGEIIGIEARAVIRREPRDGITNFEPNYMPFIEFYEEDFPWRYTPAAPDTARNRLRPWLALIVMKDAEWRDAPAVSSQPLPAVEVTGNPDLIFPPADQLWAWAHVHANRDLIGQDGVVVSGNADAARARLEALLRDNPDHAYSRLLCPRSLEAETGYQAFLTSAFETGRLAGLGLDPAKAEPAVFATMSAWAAYANRPSPTIYPYYFRWGFRTGSVGDFEYLVRLLKPRPPDSRLGRRDMDTQEPGSNVDGIAEPELGGILRLHGALKVPNEALTDAEEAEAKTFEEWDEPYPHNFQKELASFVNQADDYVVMGDPDPVITAPLYGRWHALTDRMLFNVDGTGAANPRNWVHELNLDPRWRAAAAFGTAVVQNNQENYMDAAWGQVGAIIEANRRIRDAQLAREVASVWHSRHLGTVLELSLERGLVLTAPVQRRVVAGGVTVRHSLALSTVPRAAVSAPLRRAIRPRDHVAKSLGLGSPRGADGLIERISRGEVSAAPPRTTPADLPTVEKTAQTLQPGGAAQGLADWLRRHPWARWAVLLLLLLIAALLAAVALPAALAVAAGAAALFALLTRLERKARIAHSVLIDGGSPQHIRSLPAFPDFRLASWTDPSPAEPQAGGGADSAEAVRFKGALTDVHRMLTLSGTTSRLPDRPPLDIARLAAATFEAIDPARTVPAFTRAAIRLPQRIVDLNGEAFREVMAYPEIDTPMYKPLIGLSTEHFLPNIDKIPPNTITLLEPDQRFIESYMVGLNHEFARELLWREYPTDQRGTCFRQFWDPREGIDDQGLDKEALREKLRDIPPIHTWRRASDLDDHNHRQRPGETENDLVLVIRGELLKKYDNLVIYAQKARWQRGPDGQIDPGQERIFETEGPREQWFRSPLYEADAAPDTRFIGFDLSAREAKGGTGQGNSTEPGWFFVIKERPGETRFGLDIAREGPLNVWNDLAWPDVVAATDNGFLQVRDDSPTLTLADPIDPELQEKKEQYKEDKALRWHAGTNAAELAYILYQVPVLVGVHGREMLPH